MSKGQRTTSIHGVVLPTRTPQPMARGHGPSYPRILILPAPLWPVVWFLRRAPVVLCGVVGLGCLAPSSPCGTMVGFGLINPPSPPLWCGVLCCAGVVGGLQV